MDAGAPGGTVAGVRTGWVVGVVMVAAVSCGDPSSGLPSTDGDDVEIESFAFALSTETVDGGETIVRTSEGLFDPASGNASVTSSGRGFEDRMIVVDGVTYFETPELGTDAGLDPSIEVPDWSCYSLPWRSMGDIAEPSGQVLDSNHPTGLGIERLQRMVTDQAAELELLPSEVPDSAVTAYSVTIADSDQDEGSELQDMVVRVDGEGRVVGVDWSVLFNDSDTGHDPAIGNASSATWTESMSLTLSDFGTAVEVTAPDPADTCSLEQAGIEHTCGFGAADIREEASAAAFAGDRDALREIVESFNEATEGSCPESLSVPWLVSSAACDPDMVRFLFDELELDPNQSDSMASGHTALFELTYFDPEDDPEFSQVCTPSQDLGAIRALLDAGADPCIGPDEQHQADGPPYEAPATGISEWDEAPEIVELVESAATTCSP